MTTFIVQNSKKYRTSVRLADGSIEPIRFEPDAYYGGVGESTYSTSNPQIIEAMRQHPAFGVTVLLKEEQCPADDTCDPNPEIDLETLLPNPQSVVREDSVTSITKATTWLQSELEYVTPRGMSKDEIKVEAAKRNVLFVNWK